MSQFRYPQFCALARAAEIIGERWTLLIVRELLLGPQRFGDLRQRLSGVSPSVLSERLASLQASGVVERRELEPPAASTVYQLSDTGVALAPVIRELARWGSRFLGRPDSGDLLEPAWLPNYLSALARSCATPGISFLLRLRSGAKSVPVRLSGGPSGTRVENCDAPADVEIEGEVADIVGLLIGLDDAEELTTAGRIVVKGDDSLLGRIAELFETDMLPRRSVSKQDGSSREGDNR